MLAKVSFSQRVKKAYNDTEITFFREAIVASVAALITFAWRRWQKKVDIADDLIPIAIAVVASAVIFPIFQFIWNYIRASRKILEERLSQAGSEISRITERLEKSENVPAKDWVAEWKGLADRFQTVSPYIRADWQHGGMGMSNGEVNEIWRIAGIGNPSDKKQCEALCAFAGSLLEQSPKISAQLTSKTLTQNDAIKRWLYFLKETHNAMSMNSGFCGVVEGEKGKDKIIFSGTIDKLAAVSATACITCAAAEV